MNLANWMGYVDRESHGHVLCDSALAFIALFMILAPDLEKRRRYSTGNPGQRSLQPCRSSIWAVADEQARAGPWRPASMACAMSSYTLVMR